MKKGIMKGKLAFVYLGVYAIVRFSDEFLCGDEVRGFVGPLSTSQFISLFIAAFAAFMLFVLPRIKNAPAETVAPDLENSSSVQ
jgi:phosphatidylglycerol:prolipoprotein diacylglycerol transferase